MQQLSSAGEAAVNDLARRYAVSVEAVSTLLAAVVAGGGTMAQFHHPELGGSGQWMRGGMTMVGDMFNRQLQATVDALCSELSSSLSAEQLFADPLSAQGTARAAAGGEGWWPTELGSPSSTGGQNAARYAYFPQAARLAVERAGKVTVYATGDHRIGGFQQQQSDASGAFAFTSQHGTFSVDSLPVVSSS
ncbi:MAG TPA: hypothetical protein VER33_13425 [Polyangiaceae bacterium]|nr:hypothetical protein [Polyangiaceae bacterium]